MLNDTLFSDLFGSTEPESNLDIALKLARSGIPVFPCREYAETVRDRDDNEVLRKEKSPITPKGFRDASKDEAVIRAWWRKRPGALVGMPTGKASGTAVLDVDTHDDDANGFEALKTLGLKPEELSPLRVKTGNGGLHIYFAWTQGISNAAKHLPNGLDIRGEGGFVIAPGSRFPDGRAYGAADLSRDLPVFPEELRAPPAEYDDGETGDKETVGLTLKQIKSYMEDLPNRTDMDREEWKDVMASLKHEATGLGKNGKPRSEEEKQAICQVALDWTAKNPKYADAASLKHARDTFWSFKNPSAKNLRTFRSVMSEVHAIRLDQGVENDFDEIDDFGDVDDFGEEPETPAVSKVASLFDDLLGDGPSKSVVEKESRSQKRLKKEQIEFTLGRETPDWVKPLNKRHALALVSGKTVVMHFHPDGRVSYGSVNDLHNYYENDRVKKEDTTVPITKMWMQSKFRRSFPEGIIFAPNRDVEGAYNHWQGFSVEASEARDPTRGCRLFLNHLREVACNGNEEHYRYHLGWLAHMIQKPEEKPGVAVVYKGRKGNGKDTVFEYVGELFKNHYITVASQDQMVGKFNQHQEKALLLHMQEGFWAGNKQAEGSLKYLITSSSVMIEPKGMNAFPITSVLRLFISSNERWIVPATADERRFFVLEVSERRRNDHKYFAALRAEMAGGGPSALLAYLQQYDISDFQVRAVPDTEALAEQKEMGLKNVERWWRDTLLRGEIEESSKSDTQEEIWQREALRIEKNEFRDSYTRWMRFRRFDGDEANAIEFSLRIKKMCPSIVGKQVRIGRGTRRMYYEIPNLAVCRHEFETFIGSVIIWPDDQQNVEEIIEEDDL